MKTKLKYKKKLRKGNKSSILLTRKINIFSMLHHDFDKLQDTCMG
jgi:hypothetical protein